MRISLHAISSEPQKFIFDTAQSVMIEGHHNHNEYHELNHHWLSSLLAQIERSETDGTEMDSRTRGSEKSAPAPTLPAHLEVQIVKQDGFWVLDGSFTGKLRLTCSRCADVFIQDVRFQFRSLLSLSGEDPSSLGFGPPSGGAHQLGAKAEAEEEESSREVDIEFLDDEWLELDHILREQIYLKIPFQPLCDEACKGLCVTCGQNKNQTPCQCHRLKVGSLGLALKESLKF